MLGFNFYLKSLRYIFPALAASIVQQIRSRGRPSPLMVGVFVNSPLEEVRAIMAVAQLDLAQLHGDEPAQMVKQLNGRGFKALRPASEAEAGIDAERFARYGPNAPVLLIDAHRKDQYGGTGHTADWSIATKLGQQYPILLAGGLTPKNVAEAIRQVRPWGVDVASGVEASPGKKDTEKLKVFVEQCQRLGTDYDDDRSNPKSKT